MANLRALTISVLSAVAALNPATQPTYRGFWVDTFNSNLNDHADIVAVVQNAKSANAIFAQVRRRDESWYRNSLEPQMGAI